MGGVRVCEIRANTVCQCDRAIVSGNCKHASKCWLTGKMNTTEFVNSNQ